MVEHYTIIFFLNIPLPVSRRSCLSIKKPRLGRLSFVLFAQMLGSEPFQVCRGWYGGFTSCDFSWGDDREKAKLSIIPYSTAVGCTIVAW